MSALQKLRTIRVKVSKILLVSRKSQVEQSIHTVIYMLSSRVTQIRVLVFLVCTQQTERAKTCGA